MSVSSLYLTDSGDFDVLSSPKRSPSPESPTFTIGGTSPESTASGSGYIVSTARVDEGELLRFSCHDRRSEPAVFEKHECPWFEDENITSLVKGVLFRAYEYFLRHNSSYFRGTLRGHSVVQVSSAPISPEDDAGCADFETFLSILYPPKFHECDSRTVDAWTAILRLSNEWSSASIRMLAIAHLEPITSVVDKIVLGRAYGIESWLRPGCVALYGREQPPMQEEGLWLGASDALLTTTVREGTRTRCPEASRDELERILDGLLTRRDSESAIAEKAGASETAHKMKSEETATQAGLSKKLPSAAGIAKIAARPSAKALWRKQLERAKSPLYMLPTRQGAASVTNTTTAETFPRGLDPTAGGSISEGINNAGTPSQVDTEDVASTMTKTLPVAPEVKRSNLNKRKETREAKRKRRANLDIGTVVSPQPPEPSPETHSLEQAAVLEEDDWKTVVNFSRPAKKNYISSAAIARLCESRGITSGIVATSSLAGYHEYEDSKAEAEEKWEAKQRAQHREVSSRDSRQKEACAWEPRRSKQSKRRAGPKEELLYDDARDYLTHYDDD
ncbi:hypothetical protein DENSPDRAFT_879791 [Dentipellis sp. KUC8613]|nr:hypothetical protein DENSPDRAFT_879791 [Dentipellis sp. KUC8613]